MPSTIWRVLVGLDRALTGSGEGTYCIGSRGAEPHGPNEKKGTRRSILVDEGESLSLIVSGAKRHDVKVPEPILNHILVRYEKKASRHEALKEGGND